MKAEVKELGLIVR